MLRPADINPNPPPFVAAAARRPPDTPAIAAAMTGVLMPSLVH